MNETRVFTLGADQAGRLRETLRAGLGAGAEWRQVEHARFAVKADGVNLVCYTSGKVVVQGREIDAFCRQFLAAAELAAAVRPEAPVPFDGPTIGSDEAGKGDYFGPLVVAAVFASPDAAPELAAMGVADSKTLSDLRMFPMAERIERTLDCEVRTLDPTEYNACWRRDPNVNRLLADLHAAALSALIARHPGATVIVDRFGDEDLVRSRLQQRQQVPGRLVVAPRAEAHAVVAAASVVARVHFLEGLRRCGEAAARELPKGAGPPVDAVGRQVFADGGMPLLQQVGKVHFRNTDRITGASA